MQDRINYIFHKGILHDASKKEKKELVALFYQAENEFELKSLLLNELEGTKENKLSFSIKSLFSNLWNKIENISNPYKTQTYYLDQF